MKPSTQCPFHSGGGKDAPPAFPMKRRALAPPIEYEQLRAAAPVTKVSMPDGAPAWLVTRYDDVRAALNQLAFSNKPTEAGYPMVSPVRASILLKEDPDAYPLLRLERPEHTKFRRMLARDFTHASVEKLRPFVEETVDELLTRILAHQGPVDFVEEFAMALPSRMIARLLGVPFEDTEFFQTRTKAKFDFTAPPEQAVQASDEIRAYLAKLMERKIDSLGDDITSRLVVEQVQPGHMTHKQCLATLQLLLEAGHETTGNMIALGTLTLLLHPEQKDEIVANPDLVPGAVEEMLRYHTVGHLSGARAAVEEADVAGVRVAKGEGVLCMLGAANRDPSVFMEPDHFDIHREARHHVAFGFGVHQCLGQPLARMELQTVFRRLFQRLPNLCLTEPTDQLEFSPESFTYGLKRLMVTW